IHQGKSTRTLWQNPVYRAKKDGYTEKIAIMTPKQGYAAEKRCFPAVLWNIYRLETGKCRKLLN
ncbi:hypothetical protein WAJ72_23245, partial [Acinetobacter baumannii]